MPFLADIAKIPGATVESISAVHDMHYGDFAFYGSYVDKHTRKNRVAYVNDLRAALRNARENKNIPIMKWLATKPVFVKEVFDCEEHGVRFLHTAQEDLDKGRALDRRGCPEAHIFDGENELSLTFGTAVELGDLPLVEVLYKSSYSSMRIIEDVSRRKLGFYESDGYGEEDLRPGSWTYNLSINSFELMPSLINGYCNARRQTPLMVAAQYGHASIISYLLDGNANSSVQNLAGRTALICAISSGFDQIAKQLITHPKSSFEEVDLQYLVNGNHNDLIILMIDLRKFDFNNQNLKLFLDKKKTDLLDSILAKLKDEDIQRLINDVREQKSEYRLYLQYVLAGRKITPLSDSKAAASDSKGAVRDHKSAANGSDRNEVNFRYFVAKNQNDFVWLMIRHGKIKPSDAVFLSYFNDKHFDVLERILVEVPSQAIQEMLGRQQDKPDYCSYLKYILALQEFDASKRAKADYEKLVTVIMQVDDSIKFIAKYADEIGKVCGGAQSNDQLETPEVRALRNPYACMGLAYQYARGTKPDLFKAQQYMQRAARILPGFKSVADKMASDLKAPPSEGKQMLSPLVPSAGSVKGALPEASAPPFEGQLEGQVSSSSTVSMAAAAPSEGKQMPPPLAPSAGSVKGVPAAASAPPLEEQLEGQVSSSVPEHHQLIDQSKTETERAVTEAALKKLDVFELAQQLKIKVQSAAVASSADALKLQTALSEIQQLLDAQLAAAKTAKASPPLKVRLFDRAPAAQPLVAAALSQSKRTLEII